MTNWYKKSSRKDLVPGGIADKRDCKDFDPIQLAKGVKVEMEHTDDKKLAKEIAMDHLEEFPKYYDALAEMEDKLEEEEKEDKKKISSKESGIDSEEIFKEAAAFVAEDIETFEDRINLNKRIRTFKMFAEKLAFLRKAVPQNPPGAQHLLQEILETKIFTSYPELKALLEEGVNVARDNYKKFAEVCDIVLERVYVEIRELEGIRSKLVNEVLPKIMKERMSNDRKK